VEQAIAVLEAAGDTSGLVRGWQLLALWRRGVTSAAGRGRASGPASRCCGTRARRGTAADQILRRACEALAQIGERNFYSTLAALLARAVEAGGGPDEEVERHCEASRAAAGNEDVMSQVLWRATMARVLARRDAAEEAERLAREATARAERTDFLNLRGDALLDLAEVLRLAGRAAPAAGAAREALGCYEQKGNRASSERARAVLATVDGEP
jgi:hypothetical protein